jgi:uncharacterized protein YjiS (DUF1127 family)
MLLDAALAALVAARLGSRWRSAPDLVEMDDHLRRDIGLPPAPAPLPRMIVRPGSEGR